MFKGILVSNAPSTRRRIRTMTAFKVNCSLPLQKSLVASRLFWWKIKTGFATKSSMSRIAKNRKGSADYSNTCIIMTPGSNANHPAQQMFSTPDLSTRHQAQKKKLIITFDNTIEIFQSTFSIDEQTFLTRLGGSVSSGRTLLWLFLTLLGGFQVGVDLVRFTNTQTTPD